MGYNIIIISVALVTQSVSLILMSVDGYRMRRRVDEWVDIAKRWRGIAETFENVATKWETMACNREKNGRAA
jgi:hypothetical protein